MSPSPAGAGAGGGGGITHGVFEGIDSTPLRMHCDLAERSPLIWKCSLYQWESQCGETLGYCEATIQGRNRTTAKCSVCLFRKCLLYFLITINLLATSWRQTERASPQSTQQTTTAPLNQSHHKESLKSQNWSSGIGREQESQNRHYHESRAREAMQWWIRLRTTTYDDKEIYFGSRLAYCHNISRC